VCGKLFCHIGLDCIQLQLLLDVLSGVLASQNGFGCLWSTACFFSNGRLRIGYFVLQGLVLRWKLVCFWLRNIKGFALEIEGVRTFFHNFVDFVLLSFLLTIEFFIEVVSATLSPI